MHDRIVHLERINTSVIGLILSSDVSSLFDFILMLDLENKLC